MSQELTARHPQLTAKKIFRKMLFYKKKSFNFAPVLYGRKTNVELTA
jgi:hypothetical protein